MTSRYWMTICAALVLGVALIAGQASAAGRVGGRVDDSWLTAKTKIALAADSRVKGRQVSVETVKGRVLLRGMVDSGEAKIAAGEIARKLEGVKGVKNELQVVAPSQREAVEDKDEVITARVKEQIAKELKSVDIGVRTDAGVVSVTGEVPDLLIGAQVVWTSWQVTGVKAVRNDLTVKEKKM